LIPSTLGYRVTNCRREFGHLCPCFCPYIGHAHNLHPELAEKIREAFYTFEFEGTAMRQAFDRVAFAPITYLEHWEIIRRIQEEEGIDYSL